MLSRQQQIQLQVVAFHGRPSQVWSLWCHCLERYMQTQANGYRQIQILRYSYSYADTAIATDKYSYQLWRVKWLFCLVIFVFEYVVSFCFGVFVLAPPCSTMTRAETCFPSCYSIRCPFCSPHPAPCSHSKSSCIFH